MCRHSVRYKKLIEFYIKNPPEGFVERHHIQPRCLGGSDDHTNIALLPPKAHLLCHYLLYKMYPNNKKLAHAYAMMGVNNHVQNRVLSGRLYELSKVARSKALSGIPRPEWVKEKLRKPKKTNQNYFGNTNATGNKGKKLPKRSESHQENLTNSLKSYWEEKKRKTAERNREYIELYKISPLSQREFANLHNINRNILYGVKKDHL